jgi:cysteine desulfurase
MLTLGLGKAAELASAEMDMDHAHLTALKEIFVSELGKIPKLHLNGHPTQTYPGILNYSFEYIEGEALMMAIKNVAVSSGSACTSASLEPSYVLRSLGVTEDLAHTSIRFSFG